MGRRLAAALLVVVAFGAACGGSDDDSTGVEVNRPIGAPPPGSDLSSNSGSNGEPSVAKNASVEIEVAQDDLGSAAQTVVDVATSPQVGGYLVSSVINLDEGYGFGSVSVKVPSAKFERVVGELENVGRLTRQALQGEDLTPQSVDARARVSAVHARRAELLRRIEGTEDLDVKASLREDLQRVSARLEELRQNESYLAAQTTFATIAVGLRAKPPVVPARPPLERAWSTARDMTVGVASAVVIAAGFVVPLGVILLLVYLATAPLVRRVRPRLES